MALAGCMAQEKSNRADRWTDEDPSMELPSGPSFRKSSGGRSNTQENFESTPPPSTTTRFPGPSSLGSREFPSISADRALTKGRHRLISRPGLGLTVTDFLLTTLAAGQTGTDTPFCLCDHGLVHVFLLQSLILGTLFVTLQLFVGHAHKSVGLDDTRQHLTTELWVALVFEILVERAYALTVLGTALGLVGVVSSELDGTGHGQNVL